jgi:hypothetical protein
MTPFPLSADSAHDLQHADELCEDDDLGIWIVGEPGFNLSFGSLSLCTAQNWTSDTNCFMR